MNVPGGIRVYLELIVSPSWSAARVLRSCVDDPVLGRRKCKLGACEGVEECERVARTSITINDKEIQITVNLAHALATSVQSASTECNFKALREPFQRPYWTRLWIIQEMAVASKVQILCGYSSIALLDLNRIIGHAQAFSQWNKSIGDIYKHADTVFNFREAQLNGKDVGLMDALYMSRKSITLK